MDCCAGLRPSPFRGVNEVEVTHQRLLRSMDILDERSDGVNDMMSELLMRLIDQDVSMVF